MKNFKPISFALIVIFWTVMADAALAQSTDQSSPTPIASNELVIAGPKKTNQQYFFSFTAGPGEVTLQLSVKAKASSTFVGIKIFDAELNTVTYHNMSADTSPSMALKKFDVGEKQTLVLSFNSDSSLGECRVKFGGAVEFGDSSSSASSSPQLSESNPTMSNSQTEPLTATDQSSAETQSNSERKNKTFAFSILDAVGQRFNIPTNGKLRLEMKDGSVQEIDLKQVKKLHIKQ